MREKIKIINKRKKKKYRNNLFKKIVKSLEVKHFLYNKGL